MKHIIFSLLFIAACAMEIPKRTAAELMKTPASDWPSIGWAPEYDDVIAEAGKGAALPDLPCKDLVATMKAIAKAESNFKNAAVYQEPPPPAGPGTKSVGMLQLSVGDDRNWKLECGWTKDEQLKHPIANLYCGTKMLTKIAAKYPGLNFNLTAGKYWSVTRDPSNWPGRKSYDGYKRFVAACEK